VAESITQSSRFNNSNTYYGGTVSAGGGGGALTVVNASSYSTTWDTNHTITIPAVTSGNSLIIVSRSVRDDQRVTGSTLDDTGVQEGQTGTFYTFRHIDNVTDGRTSVTITTYDSGSPASGGLHALVLEVNASAIAPASTQAGQQTSSTTSFSHGFTTTAAGACAVAVINAPGGPTLTGTGGWTAVFAASEWDKFLYTGDLGAAGAKNATGTISASGNVRTNTLAYAAA
jgi:hypothetical protein